jgi:hypothetical protein
MMMLSKKECVLGVMLCMLMTTPAYAYLDGGTGSIIVQMLFAGAAGCIALIKLYWDKLKTLIVRIKQRITGKPHAVITTKNTEQSHHDKTR